jgi:hypothetical protein
MSIKKEFLNKTKLEFYKEIKKYQEILKPTKELEGYASGVIVGEKNYPQVRTHSISNENLTSSYFNNSNLVKENYSKIIKEKARNILGSTNQIYVKKTDDRIKKELEDIYKSKKAIEFNSEYEKELTFDKLIVNKVAGIGGSKNNIKSVTATENTSTSKHIEKYTENDIKSREAMLSLYKIGINENQIINLLALGTFGIQINKKLVPTRWSISAYDKTIESYLHKKILDYKIISSYEIYTYEDKGNKFTIIILPESLSFENFEMMKGNKLIDYVNYNNKLGYKEPNTAGGFYSSKVAANEFLEKRKLQAACIVLRDITDYELHLGVVFVRESVRECLKGKPIVFSNKIEFEKYLKEYNLKYYLAYKESTTYRETNKQKKLEEFFN